MKVEIKDTAIRNLANGLKALEENKNYWKELALDAKRNDVNDFIVKGFEEKANVYSQRIFSAKQVLCELGEEFYNMVKAEMEAN